MRREKKRKILIISLIGLLLIMAAGYAAFQTNLNIKGTSKITSNWDIKITSVTPSKTNGLGENAKTPTWTNLTANMEANLYEKGDYVEYDVTIENNGTIDAKLDGLTTSDNGNEAIKITTTGYTKNSKLYKNTSQTIKVKIEYNADFNGELTSNSNEAEINLDYVQAEGGEISPTNDYLLTYNYIANGGNSATVTQSYYSEGEVVDLSPTASKEDAYFIGWNTNKDASEGIKSYVMPGNDSTLYAIFKDKDKTPPVIEKVATSATTNTLTIVVSASDEESGISKYEYSIDGGNTWKDNETNNTYTFSGLTADTSYSVQVRVTNGDKLSSTYTIKTAATALVEDIVTSGDGLYEDSTEAGRYIYRGATPNNYITYNGETAGWRIISVESDGTLKIVRDSGLTNMPAYSGSTSIAPIDFSEGSSTRYSATTTDYCGYSTSTSAYYGCNVWGSKTTMLDANGKNITKMARQVGSSTTYNLPSEESYINTYLNGTYYNSLSVTAKSQIGEHSFNVGLQDEVSSDTLANDVSNEKASTWKGTVGLIQATDYVKASTNSSCTNIYNGSYNNSSYPCKNNNYLNNSTNYWTISPNSDSSSRPMWFVNGTGFLSVTASSSGSNIRPVVYLKSGLSLTGSGTKSDPYQILNGPKTARLEKATFTEAGTNPKEVTITYPSGCGSTYTCTYSKDGGSYVTVTSNPTITFTNDGNIIAKVSDGTNTVSSSYTVNLEYNISLGSVKGGTITLDNNLATYGSTVNFTPQPNSTFTYQGATIVCDDTSKYLLDSDTTSFSISNKKCTSAVVYPSWQKDKWTLMFLEKTPAQIEFIHNKTDVAGSAGYDSTRYYMYFEVNNNITRTQMTSTVPIDVTDYAEMYASTWCETLPTGQSSMALGLLSSRDVWIDAGYCVRKDVGVEGEALVLDLSNKQGDYYVAVQRLTGSVVSSTSCYVNEIALNGKTYSYDNPS